ncbi:MAG: hypothetical protein QM529_07775 [Hydrotalea sp.]|nr:hypothetical protein [Hydrotalea sp.]
MKRKLLNTSAKRALLWAITAIKYMGFVGAASLLTQQNSMAQEYDTSTVEFFAQINNPGDNETIAKVIVPTSTGRFFIKGDAGYVYGFGNNWGGVAGNSTEFHTYGYGGSLGYESASGLGISADFLRYNQKWSAGGVDGSAGNALAATGTYNYDAAYNLITVTPSYKIKLGDDKQWGLKLGFGVGVSLNNLQVSAPGASSSGVAVAGGALYSYRAPTAATGADCQFVTDSNGASAAIYNGGLVIGGDNVNGVFVAANSPAYAMPGNSCVAFGTASNIYSSADLSGSGISDAQLLADFKSGAVTLLLGTTDGQNYFSISMPSGTAYRLKSGVVGAGYIGSVPVGAFNYDGDFELDTDSLFGYFLANPQPGAKFSRPPVTAATVANGNNIVISNTPIVVTPVIDNKTAQTSEPQTQPQDKTQTDPQPQTQAQTSPQTQTQTQTSPQTQAQTQAPATTGTNTNAATTTQTPFGVGLVLAPLVGVEYDNGIFHVDVTGRYFYALRDVAYHGNDNSNYQSKKGALGVAATLGLGLNF